MKYGRINPFEHKLDVIDAGDFSMAQRMCGLEPGRVDHGHLWRNPGGFGGVAIVVDEHSLRVPKATQRYFAIGRRLYAGAALLYAFDEYGNTIDYEDPAADVSPAWFGSADEVERAIEAGHVIRPFRAISGRIVWEWAG